MYQYANVIIGECPARITCNKSSKDDAGSYNKNRRIRLSHSGDFCYFEGSQKIRMSSYKVTVS